MKFLNSYIKKIIYSKILIFFIFDIKLSSYLK